MRRRIRPVVGAVALATALALSACGSGTQHPAAAPAPAGATPAAATAHSAAAQVGAKAGDSAANGTGAGASSVAAQGGSQPAGSSGGTTTRHADDKPGLRGSAPYVWSVTAQVTPKCVVAGRTARVTVQTARNAALAYVAVYAGEKSGAAPPFGYGYGGNADGYSSPIDGTWANTWTIRADAPVGKARVTVVVASHQTSKQVDVPFTVVDPLNGTC